MTLRQLLWRIPSIVARVTLTALPLAGDNLEKLGKLPLVWPPLEGLEGYAAIPAAAIIGAFGIIPAMFKSKRDAKLHANISLGIALIGLFVYGYFFITRVQGVAIPGVGVKYFTIGTVRTEAAMREFPHATNETLIEAAGVRGEGDLERAWTPSSVKFAEWELFISYVCLMASANYTLGSFARATKSVNPDN